MYHHGFEKDKKRFNLIKIKFKSLNNIKLKNETRKFIFIIGMPRSGTSLTEQILSSHKNVFGGGELPYIQKIYNDYLKSNENLSENDLFLGGCFVVKNEGILKCKLQSYHNVFNGKLPLACN